jgi:hypothetical protein
MSAPLGSALRWSAILGIGVVWAVREAFALWRVRGARRTHRAIHAATK